MSSLQKFHRRTNGGVPVIKLIGYESVPAGAGFYLGKAGDGTSYMYVAPKSTEVSLQWGSYNIARSTISSTNGISNTNTLYAFGSAAHPAAYYCKTLTIGGYNTWYQPAKDELTTLFSNKSATPFATTNSFFSSRYWSSTEDFPKYAWMQDMGASMGGAYSDKKNINYYTRAVRLSTV